jgi:apolipoprotein N-acyltransferase
MVLPKDRPIAKTARRSRRDFAVRYTLLASALLFGYLTVVSTVVYAIGLPFILVTLLICLTLDAQSELRLMDYVHIGVTIFIVTVVWITIVLRGI